MISINLFPHRELARKKKKEQFFVHLGLAVLAGVAISAAIYTFFDMRISAQQQRNEFIRAEIRQLDAQIRDINTLQQELNALRSRQAAVEGLQADRNLPVYLLNEMVAQLPEGVFLQKLEQDNQTITLTGVAQSQERVSELLRNLSHRSEWLSQPQLLEITAGNLALSQRDQRRVFNFSMRVTLKQGQPTAEPAAPGRV